MQTITASRTGQANQTGDVQALFQKVFIGEVMTAFKEKNVMMDLHRVRTIKNGKSAEFPMMGKNSAFYHTVGDEIDGNKINHASQIITIDDLLVSPVFIANIDEAMASYDVRSPYSTECGNALASAIDRNVLQTAILSARASSPLTGESGGSTLTLAAAGDENDADKLIDIIYAGRQTLDEKDVTGDPVFLTSYDVYYKLLNSSKVMNRDYSQAAGGNFAGAVLPEVAGMRVVPTNHMPSTNVTTGNSKYQGDFTNSLGVIMTPDAVGTTKLLDLSMDMDYEARYQGTFIVAKMAVGHGALRPSCAVEIAKTV